MQFHLYYLFFSDLTPFKHKEYSLHKNALLKSCPHFLNLNSPYKTGTHTSSCWMYAFAKIPLGIDLELSSRTVPFWKKLSDRFFHSEEKKWAKTQEKFLLLWTRKEAVGKLLGTGLSFPLSSLNTAQEKIKNFPLSNNKEIHLASFIFEEKFFFSLAYFFYDVVGISDISIDVYKPFLNTNFFSYNDLLQENFLWKQQNTLLSIKSATAWPTSWPKLF